MEQKAYVIVLMDTVVQIVQVFHRLKQKYDCKGSILAKICPGVVSCNNKGLCHVQNGTCECNQGFYGEACECNYNHPLLLLLYLICIHSVSLCHGTKNCNGFGKCDPFTGQCECNLGVLGEDCSCN